MEPFIGEIRPFAGNFAPHGWAFCNGQLLPISQNTALFSLLGTMYGGDGKTSFALPNLQGSAVMHQGMGPGLTPRVVGETAGAGSVNLLGSEMPSHNHQAKGAGRDGGSSGPGANSWGNSTQKAYVTAPADLVMGNVLQATGSSQPHNNMQPYLALNYIIALNGIFPQRP